MPEIRRGALSSCPRNRVLVSIAFRSSSGSAVHESIPLETRRDAAGADPFIDDDAQVVLLPLNVIFRLFLDRWSSSPCSRAGATSPCNAHTPSDFLSALPRAHDAL